MDAQYEYDVCPATNQKVQFTAEANQAPETFLDVPELGNAE
jgi:hypothetical protein